MLSGSVLGTAVLVDGMVQRIEEELGCPATLVLTGGPCQICGAPCAATPSLMTPS